MESAIVKKLKKYSAPCRQRKKRPRTRVKQKPESAEKYIPVSRELKPQVTVAPEVSRTTVFRRGTVKGEGARMPAGGQYEPISTAGLSEKWK